ncbi:MAG TPA: hypothetical protein VFU94_03520, partial [Conexibacter sp.]|nr:hypothetical protein [Conexibacter sp.]
LAALLGGHARPLACEELALRAREDLDHGRLREAALQVRVALDAALAELPRDGAVDDDLARRVDGLRGAGAEVAALADAALADALPHDAEAKLAGVLQRLEAALRTRIAAEARPA